MHPSLAALASVVEQSASMLALVLPDGTIAALSPPLSAWVSARATGASSELRHVHDVRRLPPEVEAAVAELLGATLGGRRVVTVLNAPDGHPAARIEGLPVPVGDRYASFLSAQAIARVPAAPAPTPVLRVAVPATADTRPPPSGVPLPVLTRELRGPLHGLLAHAEVLRTTALTHEQQDYLGQLRGSAEEMSELLERLLDLERLSAAEPPVAARPLDVGQALRQVATAVAGFAARSGVAILPVGADLPRPVLVQDPLRLRHGLLHLVRFALEAGRGGALQLESVLRPMAKGRAVLTVTVTRRGAHVSVPPPDLHTAPLSADRSPGPWSASRRLGLALAARIVAHEGGDTGISALGNGFAVRLELPVRELAAHEPEVDVVDRAMARLRAEGRSIRALVVEDSLAEHRRLAGLFARLGLGLDVVGHDVEALDRMARHRYHLVLLDLAPPDVDAEHFVREIRRRHGARPLVYAVDAHASPDDRRRLAASGVDDLLAKPLDAASLRHVLGRLLDRLRSTHDDARTSGD